MASTKARLSPTVWAAVGAIAAVLGAAIALLGVAAANHWWLFKQPVALSISTPASGSIPRCTTISGGMSLPAGSSVWLAQQGSGQPNFYNLTKATPSGSGWTATMTIGTAADIGKPFTIYAFITNDQISSVLSGVLAGPSASSFYYLTALPPLTAVRSINVVRDETETAAC